MKRALVLDGRTLSSLAVARSLGEKGYSITSAETFSPNVTSLSKYVDRSISYPSADDSPEAFRHAILSELQQRDYDVLVPTRDATTQLVSEYRESFGEVTNVYVAPPDVLESFLDKGETIKLAREAGIATPETYFPEETDISEIAEQAEYPVLIRPRRSSGSRGITRAKSAAELREEFENVSREYGTPMIQEFVEKSGYTTACVLLDKQQNDVASFSYERVKEYPTSGGPTVVGVSTDDAQAKDNAQKLLREGSWHGVAEVEYIVDQDGTPRLLEVNPRFWMPVHLAIYSGVDFPHLLAQAAQGGHVHHQGSYTTGITYRWVLPNEILRLLETKRPRDVYDLLTSPGSNTCYGVLSKRDPQPILGTALQGLRYLTDEELRASVLGREV